MHISLHWRIPLLPESNLLLKLPGYFLVDKLDKTLFIEAVVEPLGDVRLLLLALPWPVLILLRLVVLLLIIVLLIILFRLLLHVIRLLVIVELIVRALVLVLRSLCRRHRQVRAVATPELVGGLSVRNRVGVEEANIVLLILLVGILILVLFLHHYLDVLVFVSIRVLVVVKGFGFR